MIAVAELKNENFAAQTVVVSPLLRVPPMHNIHVFIRGKKNVVFFTALIQFHDCFSLFHALVYRCGLFFQL